MTKKCDKCGEEYSPSPVHACFGSRSSKKLDLLPCPWCGGTNLKAYLFRDGDRPVEYVQCQDCVSCGPDQKNGLHWNKRHALEPQPVDGEIERLQRREYIMAQHDETGRYWSGPREDIPRGFAEVPERAEGGPTLEPRVICKSCTQEYALGEKHNCPGLQPAVRKFTGVGHLEEIGYIPAGSAEERERAAQPPGPSPLALYAFAMTERYGTGYRLILGFDTLTKVQAAHKEVADLAVLARDALTKLPDPTKWDGPTHICIDNRIHIGAKDRCSRCSTSGEISDER